MIAKINPFAPAGEAVAPDNARLRELAHLVADKLLARPDVVAAAERLHGRYVQAEEQRLANKAGKEKDKKYKGPKPEPAELEQNVGFPSMVPRRARPRATTRR